MLLPLSLYHVKQYQACSRYSKIFQRERKREGKERWREEEEEEGGEDRGKEEKQERGRRKKKEKNEFVTWKDLLSPKELNFQREDGFKHILFEFPAVFNLIHTMLSTELII